MKSVASPQNQRSNGRGGPRHGGRPGAPVAEPQDLMSNQQRQADVAAPGAAPMGPDADLGGPSLLFAMGMNVSIGGRGPAPAQAGIGVPGQAGPVGWTPGAGRLPGSRIGVPGQAGPVGWTPGRGRAARGPNSVGPGEKIEDADVTLNSGAQGQTEVVATNAADLADMIEDPGALAIEAGTLDKAEDLEAGVVGPEELSVDIDAGGLSATIDKDEAIVTGKPDSLTDTAGVDIGADVEVIADIAEGVETLNDIAPKTEAVDVDVAAAPTATVEDKAIDLAPEVVEAKTDLPAATEINDKGPTQQIEDVTTYIESSGVEAKTDEATVLIEEVVGTTLPEQADIHIDRDSWVVASTYNAEVVIIGIDVFIHRDVEEQIIDTLYPPEIYQTGPVEGEIIDIDWRPPFAQIEGSEIVMTEGGYTIEMKDTTLIMYDEDGGVIVKIWGDPHVDENGDGKDEWHFGNDSTFILPDGTKICLDTVETSPGVFFIGGVDILGGKDRFHYGSGDKAGKTFDAEKWDLEHADAASDSSAGVFALGAKNEWAKLESDGKFYDVADQSWDGYLNTKSVGSNKQKPAEGLNWKQIKVADDRDLKAGQGRTGHTEKPFDQKALAATDMGKNAIAENPRLPAAGQIGNMGPAHPWNTVTAEIKASVAVGDQLRASAAVKAVLSHDVSGMTVHVDAAAQAIAGTYNSLAVIIDAHVYVHSSVERRIANQLTPPWMKGMQQPEHRPGCLVRPSWRPPFARMEGSEIVISHGGYTVEMKDTTVYIYDQDGKVVTHIHGDPHVDEGGDGKDDWHFGEDSTFILPDGTKICLDTEPNAGGEWLISKVDVLGGEDHFHYDGKTPATMTEDAAEWDAAHADRSKDVSAGVFALQENNQWALQGADGNFYDVKNESWGQYLSDRDIEFGGPAVNTTADQRGLAGDKAPGKPGSAAVGNTGVVPGAKAPGAPTRKPTKKLPKKPSRGGRKGNRQRRAQRRAAKRGPRGGRGRGRR